MKSTQSQTIRQGKGYRGKNDYIYTQCGQLRKKTYVAKQDKGVRNQQQVKTMMGVYSSNSSKRAHISPILNYSFRSVVGAFVVSVNP